MAVAPTRARADHDLLIKLLLIDDSVVLLHKLELEFGRKHPIYWYTDSAILVVANVRVVDPVREFSGQGFGNVAWKERVDGWKVKQEKNIVPMSTGHPASESQGGGDFDASTDVLQDDALLSQLLI